MHQLKEYQTNIKMGFKKLINSKKILSLFAAFMLFGTNMLMAQGVAVAQGTATAETTPDSMASSAMWTGRRLLYSYFLCRVPLRSHIG